jgi:NADPH:quinone reductase-like Zn-dependent oxidoreductase
MMALRAHHRGGPEVLVYEEAPRPVAGSGEVVVEVHAAAITFTELEWGETWTRDGVDRTPTTPSHEVSGVVVERGDGVTDVEVGTEVYGLVRFDRNGAAADYVVMPASDLARKPASVPHPVAAALPLAGLTAWQALHDHAHLQPGQQVLVHGGAGSVGSLGVQLAAAASARVTATAGARDAALVRRLGAASVIDYEREPFDDRGPVFDLVLDTVGLSTLDRSFAVVKPGGHLVTLHAPPSQERAAQLGISATFFIVAPDRGELDQLARLVDAGELEVLVAARFPLAQGRAAFESARAPGRAPGKTVLVVRE